MSFITRGFTGRGRERDDRLPPGQTLVKDWPVLDLGVQPEVTPDRWRLRVEGLVQAPVRLSLEEFMALPQAERLPPCKWRTGRRGGRREPMVELQKL